MSTKYCTCSPYSFISIPGISELAKYGSLYETLHGTIGHEDLEIHLAASRIDNTWIRDKSLLLPLSVVLEWALHICSAMRYLHESTPPVIHRDLKSANVLLAAASASAHSHSGRIIPVSLKLCDFGTSREVDHANLQTFAGTLAWTAPEILRSDGQGYALSADVYSFGVVLWELVTRAIPFADVGPFDIARNVLENNRRPPIPAQTPTVLTNLLKQCWEQQPMRRPDFGSIYRTLDLIERRGIGSEQTLGTMTAEHFAMRLNRFAVKKYIEEANQEMLVAATTTQKVPSISAEDEGKRRQNELEKWAIELSHRENNLHNKLKNMQSAHDADMSIANKIRALAIAQGGGFSAETLNADLLPSNSAEGLITQPDNRQRRDSSEDEEWLYVDTSLQCRMIQKGPG
ncbi:TKL/MLK/MLK protein kinase [Sphaeroforma arctica JP610]|uniref:TKL/MLK/MLK protein kinase n=1 Tax=Sphaeroforma arctica JP610 TaxID=667725 RepID=A0A0L0FMH7_9EUKA|nr:TKL/MLK/MLK protein kinase [Sphaeroforma arctica JP610]KNC77696.1 TKL/MLK/MLK protein kinase [Sphaeroforma arctica JP610]|eukprot:XP_014151598.1 TKL/MLK/MLK protein kinase [Sphaeroforma arctica JP610]